MISASGKWKIENEKGKFDFIVFGSHCHFRNEFEGKRSRRFEIYIIIWERWTHRINKEGTGLEGSFDSTWAMKINQKGEVLKEAVKLSDTVRITRGDEPVLWNGKAVFLAGDVVENKSMIYTVDGDLKFNSTAMSLN